MQTALTESEQQLLVDLEGTIERGQKTFVEVGNALAIIRDQRLYRREHETFDAYLTARWNFTRSYAGRIIEAARVSEMLPMGNKPETERQARELAKVPAEKRVEVMKAAKSVAESENRPVRAKDIAAVAKPVVSQEPSIHPQESSGGTESPKPAAVSPSMDGAQPLLIQLEEMMESVERLSKEDQKRMRLQFELCMRRTKAMIDEKELKKAA